MKKFYSILFLLFIGALTAMAQSSHAAKLYGMTQYGGENHKGTIFHFTPETQTITVDYEFQINVNGKAPKCDIVTGKNGQYYGTTTEGGTNNQGVIFSWDSLTSEYNELYDFSNTDGFDARGGMVLYNSKLYGMTDSGGVHNFGVIYEWDIASGTYTKKIDLDSISGKNPLGSLTLVDSLFYGFTNSGGINDKGVLFSWDPSTNVYTKKYDFDTLNGSNPVGKLSAYNGALYGMTYKGGTNDLGVIYEWNYATDVYTKKYNFNGIDGQLPMGSLTLYNNKFYGLTYEGGIHQTLNPYTHLGVIFEWNPTTNVYLKKKDFDNSSCAPLGSLVLKDNLFYGSTSQGSGSGEIFSWNPASNIIKQMYLNNIPVLTDRGSCAEYKNAPGVLSYCTMLLSGDKLLGSSSSGGGNDVGCIFEFSPDSNQITRSVHMLATNGKYPRGSLTRIGNKLFGLSTYGGNNNSGNIFEWDMSTGQFTEHFQFDGYNTGINPQGSLTLLNGKLYGVNAHGKSKDGYYNSYLNRDYTEFFSWDPVSGEYQSLYNLVDQNSLPVSFNVFNNKLILPLGKTVLDPVTNTYSYITIAKFDPVTNTFNDSIQVLGGSSINNWQNNASGNGLTYYNGKYYGMSPGEWNPAYGFTTMGTIYEWNPLLDHGIRLFDLADSSAGTYPTGDLVLVDSIFYGLTSGSSSGGPYQNGGLFRWSPTTNISQRLNYMGGNGTPTYSGGKLYYIIGWAQQHLVEYDIANDTTSYYNLPDFPESPNYPWFNFSCNDNQYLKLLEVIPNELPVLISHPDTQQTCSGQTGATLFSISDADNDTLQFEISSSNEFLIPLQNISINNSGEEYNISYSTTSQTGSCIITIIADDGYGGSVSFSFEINVNNLPDTGVNLQGTILTAIENNATYQWIDCFNNEPISGATLQSFTPEINGEYAVIITNSTNCSVTSECVSVTAVSIDEHSLQTSITLYPNPATNELNVQTESPINSLSIFNLLGQKVLEQKDQIPQINISQLTPGIYLLSVELNEKQYRLKFIKQ